jgi:Domain of unknown function (DUF4167)
MTTTRLSNKGSRSSGGRAGTHQRTPVSSIARVSRATPSSDMSTRRKYECYLALARDAAARGDIVEAENMYQHAEHYLRLMR